MSEERYQTMSDHTQQQIVAWLRLCHTPRGHTARLSFPKPQT